MQYPTSGETYAVEITDGVIARVVGLLYPADPRDEASLWAYIVRKRGKRSA